MATVTPERPRWRSRLLAVTFYLGLGPPLALFGLHRRSDFLRHHFAQAVGLVGLLAYLLLAGLVAFVIGAYLIVYHSGSYYDWFLGLIWNGMCAACLALWALAWLAAVVVALRGSSRRVPLVWRLGGKARLFRANLAGNVGLGVVVTAVGALTLHALAITRDADERPAPVYMLYDSGPVPVPRCVFALGFYRISLQARAIWGPDSVVVARLTEDNLHQALRHGRFVFLGTHGMAGDITTPRVLVRPVRRRSGCSLYSLTRDSMAEHFSWDRSRKAEVGGDLQFVYVCACDGGARGNEWRAALAPAEVRTFARSSAVGEHILWMWWDGPGRVRAVAPGPQEAARHYRLGLSLYEQRRWAAAGAAFLQAAELDPGLARAHGELGAALVRQKQWAGAEASCRRAVACDPGDPVDHRNLGRALLEQQRWAEAEAAYRRAVELDPEDAADHASLGRALWAQGGWAEAEAAYRRAAELDPEDAGYPHSLGELLWEQRKWAEAEAPYRRAAELAPENATYHNDLGAALEKQKKWAEAERAYRQAADLDARTAVYPHNLGEALWAQQKWAEAEAAYRRATELAPKEAVYHYDLGAALGRQAKWARAEAAYRQAAQLKPTNAEYQDELGVALWNQEKWAEAEAAFCRAAQLDPKNAEYHNDLGVALYEQRKWAEAERAFRRAAELDPKNPEYQGSLGGALRWQGKWAEAEEAYRAAIAAGDHDPVLPARVRQMQDQARLHPLLPAYLSGDLRPSGPEELVALAGLCRFERLHASAVGFYAAAFAADPRLADDPELGHHFSAAGSAARAAAGVGCDAPADEAGRARLRGQALAWLKADLALWAGRLAAGKEAADVRGWMGYYRRDTDLASVRGAKSLAALPEAEREQWAGLWAEVDDLFRKAGGK